MGVCCPKKSVNCDKTDKVVANVASEECELATERGLIHHDENQIISLNDSAINQCDNSIDFSQIQNEIDVLNGESPEPNLDNVLEVIEIRHDSDKIEDHNNDILLVDEEIGPMVDKEEDRQRILSKVSGLRNRFRRKSSFMGIEDDTIDLDEIEENEREFEEPEEESNKNQDYYIDDSNVEIEHQQPNFDEVNNCQGSGENSVQENVSCQEKSFDADNIDNVENQIQFYKIDSEKSEDYKQKDNYSEKKLNCSVLEISDHNISEEKEHKSKPEIAPIQGFQTPERKPKKEIEPEDTDLTKILDQQRLLLSAPDVFSAEKMKKKIAKYHHVHSSSVDFFTDKLATNENLEDLYQTYEGFCVDGKKEGYGIQYNWDGKIKRQGSFSDNKQHGSGQKTYHDNGELEFSGNMVKGAKHGPGEEFHPNGKIKFSGFYDKGLRDGFCKVYHLNGKLSFEGEYVEGYKEGPGKEYHRNGKQKYDGEFKNELKHGSNTKSYFLNGKLEYEGDMSEGMRDGYGREFNGNGKLKEEGYYYKNELVGQKGIKLYDSNGKLEYEGEMDDKMRKNGYGKEYHDSGSQKYEGGWIKDIRDGKSCKIYHENGELYYEGDLVAGKKQGWGKEYGIYGKIRYEGEYIAGQMHGSDLKVYNDSGLITFNGSMKNGKREGYCQIYNENGTLRYQGNMCNDVHHGKRCNLYNDQGSLIYAGEMTNGLKNNFGIQNWTDEDYPQYIGNWTNGTKKGKGRLYWPNGKLNVAGDFMNGVAVIERKGMVYYREDGSIDGIGSFAGGKFQNSGFTRQKHRRAMSMLY